MEIGNFIHMGADLVSQILMIYSSSPLARQLCSQLETGDPFNVDVKLDNDSKNRNAEILNVYLKAKGLKLTFKKYLKKKKPAMIINPMTFRDPHQIEPMVFYEHGERLDVDKTIEQLKASKNKPINPMIFDPMEFWDEVHLDEDKEEK